MNIRSWLIEVWIVFCHSTKTKIAVGLALFALWGFPVLGDLVVSRIELPGLMAPLSDAIQEKLAGRYDKLAWIASLGFLVGAIKSYRKNRRRLIGI